MRLKKILFRTFSWPFFLAVLLTLPFLLLVRLASYFYSYQGFNGHLACWTSAFIIGVVLLIYFSTFYYKMLKKKFTWKAVKVKAILAFALVGLYAVYGTFYISPFHFKEAKTIKEYQQLHPILRISISTWVLIDEDVLLTDLARTPTDYEKMGLEKNNYSLHFIQSDGFSHAFDLRTKDKGELRNWTVQSYFEFAGLKTLRHTGTADHLHVSLPFP